MEMEKQIDIAAQVLDVLAKNKCSIAEAEAVLHTVTAKFKESAILHEKDFLAELKHDFNRSVPPRLRRFSQQ